MDRELLLNLVLRLVSWYLNRKQSATNQKNNPSVVNNGIIIIINKKD